MDKYYATRIGTTMKLKLRKERKEKNKAMNHIIHYVRKDLVCSMS